MPRRQRARKILGRTGEERGHAERIEKELAEERARHMRDTGITEGMGESPFEECEWFRRCG